MKNKTNVIHAFIHSWNLKKSNVLIYIEEKNVTEVLIDTCNIILHIVKYVLMDICICILGCKIKKNHSQICLISQML